MTKKNINTCGILNYKRILYNFFLPVYLSQFFCWVFQKTPAFNGFHRTNINMLQVEITNKILTPVTMLPLQRNSKLDALNSPHIWCEYFMFFV